MNKLLGIPLANLDKEELIKWSLKRDSRFHYIVTPNVDHIVRLANTDNTAFINAYYHASLAILDSRVVGTILRKRYHTDIQVIPGSDFTAGLFDSGKINGYRVAVIGSQVQEIERLKSNYDLPSLLHYNPPMGFINSNEEVNKCVEFVKQNQPELLFLAVGSPRQEILAHILKEQIDFSCKAFCIGASIDFITGKEKRAPEVMQKFALEWLYRLFKDPIGKFKRYIVEGPKVFLLLFRDDFFS